MAQKENGVRQGLQWGWLRLLGIMASMYLAEQWVGNPFLGALVFLALYVVGASLAIGTASDDVFARMDAYLYYSRMRLFSTIAVDLGTTMMFCHLLISMSNEPMHIKYLVMVAWVVLITVVGWLYGRIVRKRWGAIELAEFVIGATIWTLGDIFMLQATTVVGNVVWTIVWVCGIVLISYALEDFSRDFESVAAIGGEEFNAESLQRSDRHTVRLATLAASGVTMAVIALWTLSGRRLAVGADLPRLLHITMLQLPILFMLVALCYAIKQPLDGRNREKLMHYIGSHTSNENIMASLRHTLVRGQKVSFWSRLLCWVAMPFFNHKVSGKEHLRKDEYPSVFVCNHGFVYGPIVAALFLPTYFRPWIHDRMLREDLAEREISMSLPWVKKVLGKRIGGALTSLAARLVTRLLLSFRPIPVVRGASHDTMSTFDQSLKALEEGDNLMIFAEKPKRLNTGANPDLRNLYTGFAHLGKLYHDATSNRLLFYPVYSNRKKRLITIGTPIPYDPALPPRDAKQAIAEALQQSMEHMMQDANRPPCNKKRIRIKK